MRPSLRIALLSILAASAALPATAAQVNISEIFFNPDGTDAPFEYIELFGPANGTIAAGTYFVAIEGDNGGGIGDVQSILNLSGLQFGANGYMVFLQKGNSYTTNPNAKVYTSTTTNSFAGVAGGAWSADTTNGGDGATLENASATWMVIRTATAPTLSNDIDSDNDGVPNGSVWNGWTVLDSIAVLDGNNNADRTYGALGYFENTATPGKNFGKKSVSVGFTPAYVARIGKNVAYDAWFAADSDPGAKAGEFVFEPVDITLKFLANKPMSVMDLGGPNTAAVPEPATVATAVTGLALLLARRRRLFD